MSKEKFAFNGERGREEEKETKRTECSLQRSRLRHCMYEGMVGRRAERKEKEIWQRTNESTIQGGRDSRQQWICVRR